MIGNKDRTKRPVLLNFQRTKAKVHYCTSENKMRNFKFLTIFVLIGCFLFFSPLKGNTEQYLCISELSTGFSYNETSKSWERTNFKAVGEYIISKSKDGIDKYKVTRLGKNVAFLKCKDDFNKRGTLSCKAFVENLFFNKNNGRFIYIFPFGFINVLPEINKKTDETSDTPYMEIGKCSPF